MSLSLFSCFTRSPAGSTTSPILAQRNKNQGGIQVSSLQKMFEDTESIKNTAEKLRTDGSCIIETNQNYYHAYTKNDESITTVTREPKLGVWVSIKQIFSSLFINGQSRENTLKKKINEALEKIAAEQYLKDEQILTSTDENASQSSQKNEVNTDKEVAQQSPVYEQQSAGGAVTQQPLLEVIKQDKLTTARTEQKNIGEICCNRFSNQEKKLFKDKNTDVLTEKTRYKLTLFEKLTGLSERIITSIGFTGKQKCLNALSAAHSDLVNLGSSMVDLSAENNFDESLNVLLCFTNTHSVALKGMTGMQTILMSLCGRLAHLGANPSVAFASLADFSTLPEIAEFNSWLRQIIIYTHPRHKEAAVDALGKGALKETFIAELNKCLAPMAVSVKSEAQQILNAWQAVPGGN